MLPNVLNDCGVKPLSRNYLDFNLNTCSFMRVDNYPIIGMSIIFCLFMLIPHVTAQENQNIVTIVPGASSPRNPEFFMPNMANVTLGINGTIVVWTNNDATIHTVNSGSFNTGDFGPQPFQSGGINPGGIFRHHFTIANTYEYYCSIHPFMTGKITAKN